MTTSEFRRPTLPSSKLLRAVNQATPGAARELLHLLFPHMLVDIALVMRKEGQGLRQTLVEEQLAKIPDSTFPPLENFISQGTVTGGEYWAYLPNPRQQPPVPPGVNGDPIAYSATETRARRRYAWPVLRSSKIGVAWRLDQPDDVVRYVQAVVRTRVSHVRADVLRTQEGQTINTPRWPEEGDEVQQAVSASVDPRPTEPGNMMGEASQVLAPEYTHQELAQIARNAEQDLEAAFQSCRRDSASQRFVLLTRLFLVQFLEECAARSTGRPRPFEEWLGHLVGEYPSPEMWASWTERLHQVDWNTLYSQLDIRRWRELVQLNLPADEQPYYRWWGGCDAILVPRPDAAEERDPTGYRRVRNTSLENPKRHLEDPRRHLLPLGKLTWFYRLLNHIVLGPGGGPAGGGPAGGGPAGGGPQVRDPAAAEWLWRRFTEGDVTPEEAAVCRQALDESDECFWQYNDLLREWRYCGYEPQPEIAMLRERLHAGVARLHQRLGSLPVDLGSMADTLVRAHRQVLQLHPAISAGSEPYHGFCYPQGRAYQALGEISLPVIRENGIRTGETGQAQVVSVQSDPETGAARIRLRVREVPATARVIVAQAGVGDYLYSLAGVLDGDEVEITVDEFPVELGGIYVRAWYAVNTEEAV